MSTCFALDAFGPTSALRKRADFLSFFAGCEGELFGSELLRIFDRVAMFSLIADAVDWSRDGLSSVCVRGAAVATILELRPATRLNKLVPDNRITIRLWGNRGSLSLGNIDFASVMGTSSYTC